MSKSKKDPLRGVGNVIRDTTSNVEAGLQDFANYGKEVFSGNFNNIGQSGLSVVTSPFLSRRQRREMIGETSNQRRLREGEEKAAADVVQDAQNQVNAQGQLIADTIMGLADSRKRTPGRRQVMSPNLLSQMQSNSLLSGGR